MNNTLPALLNWMRERSRLFDWDMIVSLDRAKYNRLLSQEYRVRSMNPTYRQMELRFTVASPVSSSTAAALRSPLPTRHAATAP
ncbi:hypothetical protein, partial [Pseudomonas capeferrum]|uniref:hypothetical protein n=1 Tax=Pseudomonas capeferrum TaxID=1495066 RepID=UPI0030DD2D6C